MNEKMIFEILSKTVKNVFIILMNANSLQEITRKSFRPIEISKYYHSPLLFLGIFANIILILSFAPHIPLDSINRSFVIRSYFRYNRRKKGKFSRSRTPR